ncbi:MAG: hypothetical protein VX768_04125 [Planctomycetota bacterium]|nr:hypothetical protein [Planctomycetota bacterium]
MHSVLVFLACMPLPASPASSNPFPSSIPGDEISARDFFGQVEKIRMQKEARLTRMMSQTDTREQMSIRQGKEKFAKQKLLNDIRAKEFFLQTEATFEKERRQNRIRAQRFFEQQTIAILGSTAKTKNRLKKWLSTERPYQQNAADLVADLGAVALELGPTVYQQEEKHPKWNQQKKGSDGSSFNITFGMGEVLRLENRVPSLVISLLGSPHEHEHRWAARLLIGMGPSAAELVPLLTGWISDPATQPERMFTACHILGNIGPKAETAIGPLFQLLCEADEPIALSAQMALMEIGTKTVRYLANQLDRQTPEKLVTSLKLMGELYEESRSVLPRVRPLLKHASPNVRYQAAQTHWLISDDATPSIPVFLDALCRPDLQSDAAKSLYQIDKAATPAMDEIIRFYEDPKTGSETKEWLMRALCNIGAPAMKPMLRALRTPDTYLWSKVEIVCTLGEIGPPAKEAIPILVKTCSSEFLYLRWKAAGALHRVSGKTDIPVATLLIIAKEGANSLAPAGHVHTANRAIRYMGQMGPAAHKAIPELERYLLFYERHRKYAAEALARIGGRGVKLLKQHAQSEHDEIAKAAQRALKNHPQKTVIK